MQLARLILAVPVIQAPMAGVSTPALAAAVSHAGGLGSIAVGAMTIDAATAAIEETGALTGGPFGVNLFCHQPPRRDAAREAAWLDRLAPHFSAVGATAPPVLRSTYPSFLDADFGGPMLDLLIRKRPAVVSFHFGLPDAGSLNRLRAAGIVLAATATSRAEADAIVTAGLDLIVAQGWEAGGHRGSFDPDARDARLPLPGLLHALRGVRLPVIAAGGIMDRADRMTAMSLGAAAVQCGTAFVDAPEATTTAPHRAALKTGRTVMTRAISGRAARSLENLFTRINGAEAPDYPVAYDAGKALNAAALAAGEGGYGAQWAGTGAARTVARPAAETLRALAG